MTTTAPAKILVVQLARLGDIYQTTPALAALRRNYPSTEIHLLTRAKFAGAAPKEQIVNKHWVLNTRDVLAPLVDERPDIDASVKELETLCSQLRDEKFDRIVNLSFSSFSSFFIREIVSANSVVAGYTRFDDGTLSIPDDGSAYFYAQVGPERANRIHLCDLFAHISGVDLQDADWQLSFDAKAHASAVVNSTGARPIVVHIGASDLGKTLSWSKWLQVVKTLADSYEGRIVLVGSHEERAIAERASAVTGQASGAPLNLAGKTTLDELCAIVSKAALVIGGDSAPIHIASLANVPVLNLSLPMVSFWETGPRSKGSRIIRIESEEKISAQEIATEAFAMVNGRVPTLEVVRVPDRMMPYLETRPQPKVFEWEFLKSIYMSEPFPAPPHESFITGVERLIEVNTLAFEQIEALRRIPTNKTASAILDRVDEIMIQIQNLVPELQPLVTWFQVERMRLGPMELSDLINATESIHKQLSTVLEVYGAGSDEGNLEGEGRV